jgi:predicted cupin superfamily sugar epimerase
MSEASTWIESLQMQRHPEGGWFREVYRSGESIPHQSLPSRFSGERTFSTAIYYLLDKTEFSSLHRIQHPSPRCRSTLPRESEDDFYFS